MISKRLLSLEGRGVAVTGGGSGIGRAVAIPAAQLGARVTIGDRNPEGGGLHGKRPHGRPLWGASLRRASDRWSR